MKNKLLLKRGLNVERKFLMIFRIDWRKTRLCIIWPKKGGQPGKGEPDFLGAFVEFQIDHKFFSHFKRI